jgi:hypothetical protein
VCLAADWCPSARGGKLRFGRKPKLTKHWAREALKRVAAGEPLRELPFNVDYSTISPLKAHYAAEMI